MWNFKKKKTYSQWPTVVLLKLTWKLMLLLCYCQWPTLLGVAGTGADAAAALGCGMTGAPKAPWVDDRPASLTSPDREEVRLSRDACWPTRVCVINKKGWVLNSKNNQLKDQQLFPQWTQQRNEQAVFKSVPWVFWQFELNETSSKTKQYTSTRLLVSLQSSHRWYIMAEPCTCAQNSDKSPVSSENPNHHSLRGNKAR